MNMGDRFHSRPAIMVSVCLYCLLSAWMASLSWGLVGKTFPGFGLNDTPAVEVVGLDDWPGMRMGVKAYDRIRAVDGRAIHTQAEVYVHVRARPAGTPIVYDFQRPDGSHYARAIPSAVFTLWDLVRVQFFWQLSGLLHVLVGAFALWRRPELPAARSHWRFCLLQGTLFATAFNSASHCVVPVAFLAAVNGGIAVAVVDLALSFPIVSARRQRWVRGTALGVLALLGVFAIGVGLDAPWRAVAIFPLLVAASVGVLASGVRWAWLGFSRHIPPVTRSQASIAAGGMIAGMLVPIADVVGAPLLGQPSGSMDLSALAMCGFPIALAYAIVRHQAFDITVVLRRGALYGLLVPLLGALYAGTADLGALVAGNGLAGFAAALVVAFALRPLHDGLKAALDRLFVGERLEALTVLTTFSSQEPTGAAVLADALLDLTVRALRPAWATVTFAGQVLAGRGVPEAGGQVLGVLTLGPRANGLDYSPTDLATAKALADHAALAIERAMLADEQAALRQRAVVARALAAERQNLIQQIVHDARTDLANIAFALGLARRLEDPEPALVSAESSVARLAALLDEKSRQATGGRAAGSACVGEVAEGVAQVLASQLAERRQTLVREIEQDARVPLTPVELGQVLLNLLTNASRHSPDGATLRLVVRGSDVVTIQVHDAGPGIAPEVEAALAAGRPPARPVGQGLGIANVRALIAPIGGALTWRSTPTGTVFALEMPIARTGGSSGGETSAMLSGTKPA